MHADDALGVRYRARLPVAWVPRPAEELDSILGSLDHRAEQVLRAVIGLEEVHPPPSRDDDGHLEQELAHIDFRLNLLLELVGQLVRQQAAPPPETLISIAAHEALWRATPPLPAVGSTGLLEVNLHTGYPAALALPCEVLGHKEDGRVLVRWRPLTETTQALLERFIFLHHRRDIAQRRGNPGS